MSMFHTWRQCRPMSAEFERAAHGHRIIEATWIVWATLTDAERAAFHRFTCLRRRGRSEVDTITNMTRQIKAEAGIYDVGDFMEEFDLAPAVVDRPALLEELTALGVPHEPVAESSVVQIEGKFLYFVVRQRDVDPDDLHPSISIRKTSTVCEECRESCWQDPMATPEGPLRVLCIACARRTLIALRQAGTWPC